MFWKEIKKITRENAFEHKKKKQELKCNPGLALIAHVSATRIFYSPVFAVFIKYFFTARSNYFYDSFNSSGHGSWWLNSVTYLGLLILHPLSKHDFWFHVPPLNIIMYSNHLSSCSILTTEVRYFWLINNKRSVERLKKKRQNNL